MAMKTRIGIVEPDGKIRAYNGETYTPQEIALIERNIESNRLFVLAEEALLSKQPSHRLVMETVIDNVKHYFEFDLIKDVSINSTSTLTEHPLVTGDMIADHMYREPATMTVTGKFSLQGNQRYPYEGAGERLANIETLFERIKNEGITSTLMTMYGYADSSSRFKVRESMALTSIQWTEHLNSVDFTFSFNEVLMADVQKIEPVEDYTDPNLPALTDASSLDFTTALLDWDAVDEIIIKELVSIEAVTSEFLQYACDTAKNMAIGTATGIAGGIALGFVVLQGIALACGSVPVYGWIVGLAIVAAGAIAGACIAMFNSIKNEQDRLKYKIKQFTLYEDDKRNQQEVKEFANYLGNVHKNLQLLNDVIQVYAPTSNENQECMTHIDDNYYIFRFMQNNVDNTWSLVVTDIEGKQQGDAIVCNSSALGSIAECNRNNCIFRTRGGGYYVYLINKQYVALLNNNATKEQFEEAASDLRNYYIVVSQIDMEQFNETLSSVILDAMKM